MEQNVFRDADRPALLDGEFADFAKITVMGAFTG
jgi:hypothetical protein